ncbi:MAG: YgaP family membrane protein [Granulosicoccaceae bacterium]
MFKKNVGGLDMLLRLLLATMLFYLGFLDNPYINEPNAKLTLGVLGFVPLLTAALRFCPLYLAVGVNTLAAGE